MKVKDRVQALRSRMRREKLAAYIVPTTDPHQSEYVPACWERRAWISGFTGSNGEVVITRDDGGLWTDGRYFLQAGQQLRGSGLKLQKMGNPQVPSVAEYLIEVLRRGDRVGIDPRLISWKRERELRRDLEAAGLVWTPVEENLVDALWTDRPSPSAAPLELLATRYAGQTRSAKLRRVRREMAACDAQAHVLSTLDAIAWLFNIRGVDVDYNPVVIAYAIVESKRATLFVDPAKVPASVARTLGKQVRLQPYDAFGPALDSLRKSKARVWVEGKTASAWVMHRLGDAVQVTDDSPVGLMKARKNATEVSGMRACHVRDGVAMVRFLRWLETAVPAGGVTELSAAHRLEEFRREGEHFRGLSFGTISGYAAHGAIIHYSADARSNVELRPRGIYLVDSGGQYLDGTTDITRTVLLGGRATREQKDRFTRVLRGHIALASARFPEGTTGARLDTLARLPLWEAGLDYNHGTGHGVGSYLNVHEGPQSISHGRGPGAALEPGNVQSNEPGYYEDGAYGIRIENLVLVEEDAKLEGFLRFRTITLCPIDRRLIDLRQLSAQDRAWLNAYHRDVLKELGPRLDAADRKWLKAACAKM